MARAFGRVDEYGETVQGVSHCAWTGERLPENGAVIARIKDTRLFYGLTPQAARSLTDEQREALEAELLEIAQVGKKGSGRVHKPGAPAE